MTSHELSEEVATAALAVMHRIETVGARQYEEATGKQRFEEMPLADLYQEGMEELEDIIAYAVMLRVRLLKLKEATIDRGHNHTSTEAA